MTRHTARRWSGFGQTHNVHSFLPSGNRKTLCAWVREETGIKKRMARQRLRAIRFLSGKRETALHFLLSVRSARGSRHRKRRGRCMRRLFLIAAVLAPCGLPGCCYIALEKGICGVPAGSPVAFVALFAARLPRPFRVRTKQAWLLRALNGFRVCGHAHAAEPLRFRRACSRRKGTGIAPRFIFRLTLEAGAPTAFSPPSQRFCPPVRSSRR